MGETPLEFPIRADQPLARRAVRGALLDKLAAIDEGGTSVLDAAAVVFAAASRDGNAHDPHDLPILLAGRANGTLPQGRLIASKRDIPLCNLWLALLQRIGVPVPSFGDSERALF